MAIHASGAALILLPLVVGQSYSFCAFEDTIFPRWIARFRVANTNSTSSSVGAYSLLPTTFANGSATIHNKISLYGATDLVYAMHAVGQLTLRTNNATTRAAWGALIGSFQNKSTGFPTLYSWEKMHTANPPYAAVPWHAAGAMVDTMQLLASVDGAAAAALPPPSALTIPFTSVGALLNGGESAWIEFMQKWLTNYSDVWMGSQAVQSLAVIVKLAPTGEDVRNATKGAFFTFLRAYLNRTASNTTGMWDGKPHQDAKHQLGGAFHIFHVLECFGLEWPFPARAVDATLASQDCYSATNKSAVFRGSGTWGCVGNACAWANRATSWPTKTPSSCIDLDGVYTLSRGARQAGGGGGGGGGGGEAVEAGPYRWNEVKNACSAYVRTAHYLLTDEERILGAYGANTHVLHGVLYAVAECQLHFPDLVHTRRKWKRWASSESCIYA